MTDLVQQVRAAIDTTERGSDEVHTLRCDRVLGSITGNVNDPCDCGEPDRIRRRCTADRKLIAEVQSWQHEYVDGDPWYSCAQSVNTTFGADGTPGSGCADDSRAGTGCDCGLVERQLTVLSLLAESYGITVEAG